MITLTPSIKAIIESKAHRFANLWKLTKKDASVLRFTDFQKQIEFEGNTYNPIAVADQSAVVAAEGLSERNRSFAGYLSSSALTEDDLRSGLYNDATVQHYQVDWKYPWQGSLLSNTFFITEIKWTGQTWEADLNGLTTKLRQFKGMTISRNCRFVLGDTNCGIDLSAYTDTDSVASVTTQRRSITSGITGKADNYYADGMLTFTSGANSGRKYEVISSLETAGAITFLLPTFFDIEVNDDFIITPGCNHTDNHCKGNNNRPWATNYLNFGGFPDVPGTTAALTTPDSK